MQRVPVSSKEVNIQNFLTRAEKFQRMEQNIPCSTSSCIIVKSNNEGAGFRFDSYSKEYLQGLVPKETFDATVKGAHKICEAVWSIRKQEEERVYNVWAKRIFLLSIFILFVSLIFIIVKSYGTDIGDWVVYVSLGLMLISSVTTLVLIHLSMFQQPKFTEFESTITKKLQAYLEKENATYYLKKGMEWRIGDKFYWLELHVNDKKSHSRSPSVKKMDLQMVTPEAKQKGIDLETTERPPQTENRKISEEWMAARPLLTAGMKQRKEVIFEQEETKEDREEVIRYLHTEDPQHLHTEYPQYLHTEEPEYLHTEEPLKVTIGSKNTMRSEDPEHYNIF